MAKQITATITFILHEDLDDGEKASVLIGLIDCLEHERVGVAQYNTVKVHALTAEEAKDE